MYRVAVPGAMDSTPTDSAFAAVPAAWFEPVVGLWVVLGATVGIHAAFGVAGPLLSPLGTAPWAAVVLATGAAAIVYGALGFGLVAVYRTYRDFEPAVPALSLDRPGRYWLARLAALGVLVMGLGGAALSLLHGNVEVAAPILTVGTPPYPPGIEGVTVGVEGVNELVGQAGLVAFTAVLASLLMGPAAGALFHGVLQDTLARVAPPRVAVAGTAVVTAATLEHSAVVSRLTLHEAVSAAVAFGFVLGVATVYRRSGNLLVAMAAYGAFNVLAVVLGWLSIVASLAATGHLFG